MTDSKIRVLAVDDNPGFLAQFKHLLGGVYRVMTATTGEQALQAVRQGGIDAVLLDLDLGRGTDGFEVLADLHKIDPDLPVFMLSRDSSPASVVEAMRRGAADYIPKITDLNLLVELLHRAMDARDVRDRYHFMRERIATGQDEMVGRSEATKALRRQAQSVAATRAPILIVGETGTGKEVVARLIHRLSCPDAPFIPCNCAAVPAGVIETELFGCVPGAFSDAKLRRGCFEVAGDGILYLDELTEADASFQAKLNRVIESNEFVPVGAEADRTKVFRGRVVASTNRDLATALLAGKLRGDLRYRFPQVISVPPLRQRLEDIPLLVDRFLELSSMRYGRSRPAMTQEQMGRLLAHSWPGNVRELRNVIENYVLGGADGAEILPPITATDAAGTGAAAGTGQNSTDFRDLLVLPYKDAARHLLLRLQAAYIRFSRPLCGDDEHALARHMGLTMPGLRKILRRLEGGGQPPISHGAAGNRS